MSKLEKTLERGVKANMFANFAFEKTGHGVHSEEEMMQEMNCARVAHKGLRVNVMDGENEIAFREFALAVERCQGRPLHEVSDWAFELRHILAAYRALAAARKPE